MRILILGVGNPVLSDDGVGIHVARMLRDRGLPGVDVEELPASGLELLDGRGQHTNGWFVVRSEIASGKTAGASLVSTGLASQMSKTTTGIVSIMV